MFEIIDTHSKAVVGTAKTLKSASRKCNNLDLKYGACRYVYKRQAQAQQGK